MIKNISFLIFSILLWLTACSAATPAPESTVVDAVETTTIAIAEPTEEQVTVAVVETPTATPKPPTMTRAPAEGIGRTNTRAKDEAVMMYVPAGEFYMGSDNGNSNEQPVHIVTTGEFWIDQTEVTNGQYERCVADGQCEESSYADNNDFNGAQQPVVGVSWYDANAYCSWVNGRLPTEAEWEYAAKGTDGNIYPWGNELPNANLFNYNKNVGKTTAVNSYSPNGDSWIGASDMAGNVWEWTSTLYQPYPYDANDGREDMDSTNVRVLRGGSWGLKDSLARTASRFDLNSDFRYDSFGFRCVQE